MKIDIHRMGSKVTKLKEKLDDKDLAAFLKAKRIGKFGKKIEKHQESKYMRVIDYFKFWFKKPLHELTEDDTTNWYISLQDDTLLTDDNKPYKNSSKNTFVRVFKTYMRYLCEQDKYKDKENMNYDKLAKWMKPFKEHYNIPALSKEEVIKLATTNNLKNQALIMVMFDTGARIQEVCNIRLSDCVKVEDGQDYYFKITLREEFSKTKGREISCRLCKDVLLPYYERRKKEVNSEEDVLFDVTYEGIKKVLDRSKKATGIKKRVSPHIIRHSAATYFASVLQNPYHLEYRFGWSIGDSKMANRYIDRDKLLEKEASKTIKTLTMSELKEENERMKIRMLEIERKFMDVVKHRYPVKA